MSAYLAGLSGELYLKKESTDRFFTIRSLADQGDSSLLARIVKGARVNLKARERKKQSLQFDCNLSVHMKSSSEFTGIDVRSPKTKWFQKSSVWIVISMVILLLGIILLTTVLLVKKMSEKSTVFLPDNPE